ncbi:640_t:CDS:2, partial [Gigaspora rosea]
KQGAYLKKLNSKKKERTLIRLPLKALFSAQTTPIFKGLVPQKMEIKLATKELDKPTPTVSEMEILMDSKEPSSTQSILQEELFIVHRVHGITPWGAPGLKNQH